MERKAQEPASERNSDLANEYPSFLIGEARLEPSWPSMVQAFEIILDPMDEVERRAVLATFCLRAAALGYASAAPPLSVPAVGFREGRPERPLSAVFLFLIPPSSPSSSTRTIR